MKEKEEDEENKIRKFAQNRQTDKQTNKQRFQIQRPLLSPVDRWGKPYSHRATDKDTSLLR